MTDAGVSSNVTNIIDDAVELETHTDSLATLLGLQLVDKLMKSVNTMRRAEANGLETVQLIPWTEAQEERFVQEPDSFLICFNIQGMWKESGQSQYTFYMEKENTGYMIHDEPVLLIPSTFAPMIRAFSLEDWYQLDRQEYEHIEEWHFNIPSQLESAILDSFLLDPIVITKEEYQNMTLDDDNIHEFMANVPVTLFLEAICNMNPRTTIENK